MLFILTPQDPPLVLCWMVRHHKLDCLHVPESRWVCRSESHFFTFMFAKTLKSQRWKEKILKCILVSNVLLKLWGRKSNKKGWITANYYYLNKGRSVNVHGEYGGKEINLNEIILWASCSQALHTHVASASESKP
jgi:hypothetical protein